MQAIGRSLALLVLAILAFAAGEARADAELAVARLQPTLWRMGRALVRLVPEGEERRLVIVEPDGVMAIAGMGAGSLIFAGRLVPGGYAGTAYHYAPECGRIGYAAEVAIAGGGGRLTISGLVPLRHPRTCAVTGVRRELSVLELVRVP